MTKSSPSIWELLLTVKLMVKILSIFVAFSENVNFKEKSGEHMGMVGSVSTNFCIKVLHIFCKFNERMNLNECRLYRGIKNETFFTKPWLHYLLTLLVYYLDQMFLVSKESFSWFLMFWLKVDTIVNMTFFQSK